MLSQYLLSLLKTMTPKLNYIATSSIPVVSNNCDLSTTTDNSIQLLLITVICTAGCLIIILILAIVSLTVCLRRDKTNGHIYKMGQYDKYYSN